MRTSKIELSQPKRSKKVFVGCIPGDAEEKKLVKFFKSLGNIENVKMKYKTELVNAGFCIVTCGDEKTYDKFLNKDIVYQRRRLECRPYMEHSELQKFRKTYNKRRIYVYNILSKTTDKEIKRLFEMNIGGVENAYCIRKQKKRSRGLVFGYVLFREMGDAERAVQLGHLNLRGQLIKIKKFIDKEEQHRVKPSSPRVQFQDPQGFGNRRTTQSSMESLDQTPYKVGNFGQNYQSTFQGHPQTQFKEQQVQNSFFNNGYGQRQQLYNQIPVNNEFKSEAMVGNLRQFPQKKFNYPSEKRNVRISAVKKCFELQRPIWRNHSIENLRFN